MVYTLLETMLFLHVELIYPKSQLRSFEFVVSEEFLYPKWYDSQVRVSAENYASLGPHVLVQCGLCIDRNV